MYGGAGVDSSTGGVGADRFLVAIGADESGVGAGLRDVITGYNQTQGDKIVLFPPPNMLFLGAAAFNPGPSDPNGFPGEYRFDTTILPGSTVVQFDFDGNDTVDAEIQFTGTFTLTQAGDFSFVSVRPKPAAAAHPHSCRELGAAVCLWRRRYSRSRTGIDARFPTQFCAERVQSWSCGVSASRWRTAPSRRLRGPSFRSASRA